MGMKRFLILIILMLIPLGCASKGYWVKNGSSDFDKEQFKNDFNVCMREGIKNADRIDRSRLDYWIPVYGGQPVGRRSSTWGNVFENTSRACMEEKGYSWREKVD